MSVDLYEKEREELEPHTGLETVKLLREVKEQITWPNSCCEIKIVRKW